MKAFPCDSRESNEFAGMDLRDYFAAKALQGMMAHPEFNIDEADEDLAILCYVMATYMMKIRGEEA